MKKLLVPGIVVVFIIVLFPVLATVNTNLRITAIEGQVEKLEEKIFLFGLFRYRGWNQLDAADALRTGDIIRTGKGGSLEFFFDNGTYIKIGEESQFKIGEGEIREPGMYYSLHLTAGRLWAKVKGAWTELTKFEVITPSAVAGVKGTLFSVFVEDNKTTVSVQEGQIALTNVHSHKQEFVNSGKMGIVSKGILKVRDIDKEEEGYWSSSEIEEWLKGVQKGFIHDKDLPEEAENNIDQAKGRADEAQEKVKNNKDQYKDEDNDEDNDQDEDNDEDEDNDDDEEKEYDSDQPDNIQDEGDDETEDEENRENGDRDEAEGNGTDSPEDRGVKASSNINLRP